MISDAENGSSVLGTDGNGTLEKGPGNGMGAEKGKWNGNTVRGNGKKACRKKHRSFGWLYIAIYLFTNLTNLWFQLKRTIHHHVELVSKIISIDL